MAFEKSTADTYEAPLPTRRSCGDYMRIFNVARLGTASGGFRIIRTVGFQITKIKPVQGFASELSASIVILTASFLGMPVSSTHMIVGSVTGVGAAKSVKAVQWALGKKLILAWVLTLPGSAFVAGLCYYAFSYFVRS